MSEKPLRYLVRKLRSRSSIGRDAETALLNLPYTTRTYDAPAYLIREGSTNVGVCSMIVSGFAFGQRLTFGGKRQILSLHMRGDLLDLQNLFLAQSDHSVQALTRLETIDIRRSDLRQVILGNPEVGTAIWIDALVDSAIYRDWITNVGQRNARARIAHLLCEFAVRAQAAGLDGATSLKLPMTQEQIGDAVGLTGVHVNRTLRTLESEGIIKRDRRELWFTNWDVIRTVGDFTSIYLHLNQVEQFSSPNVVFVKER